MQRLLRVLGVTEALHWRLSHRFDPHAVAIADRHYNRQKPGTPQFCPPGKSLVLVTDEAVWASSWPAFAMHDWAGAWVNTTFRREGGARASNLIREAVAITRWRWPAVPELGMVTFVDPRRVEHKRRPGRVYLLAGFREVGVTAKGLLVFQMLESQMPAAVEPMPMAGRLLAV